MKSLIDYVEKAPALCRQIIDNGKNLVAPLVELYCAKEYKKIVMVASGSSGNIANSIKYYIQDILGVEVKVVWPVTYINYDYKFNEDALILCMSQSGRSTNTINSVKKANELKQDVAVLTSNPDSTIKAYAKHVVDFGVGSDDYYVCKGYPGSITFLAVFALEAALQKKRTNPEEYKKQYKELEAAIDMMKKSIALSKQFYAEHRQELLKMRRIMVAGCGNGYGMALEGTLKINETTGIITNAYEMEEMMHGPCYEITKDHGVFLIDNNEKTHERMMQLSQALTKLTDKVYVISNIEKRGDRTFFLESQKGQDLSAIYNVIPFQIISDCICTDLDTIGYSLAAYDFEQMMRTKA